MDKTLPVTILLVSYNRKNLLKKCLELINERTFHPFRIIVVDNGSTDGSVGFLKEFKVQGKIFDHVLLPNNLGQCEALNKGWDAIEDWENNKRRPSNDFIVTTQDDLYPPMLGQDKCWLTQMIDILERHEPEYGGLSMRIQRTPRTDIDENKEVTPGFKNFPSVFRLMRRSDIGKLGNKPFGILLKWESNTMGESYKTQIRKKFGFTTHIYADHAGFMLENKGYGQDVDTFTVAENKVNERNDKPYPDIDPVTNVPVKINHDCDKREQILRENYQALLDGKVKRNEVTIIILTCKRLEGFKRILNSVIENTKDVPYDLLVVADNADTQVFNYCLENDIQCLLSTHRRDFVAQANLAIYASQTPYFVLLADDMQVLRPDWLGKALKAFKTRFADNSGLMSFKDGIQDGRIFTAGMSSKKFVRQMGGNLYYPGYLHYKGDREITELAREFGLYHYEETIEMAHYHPTNKNIENPNTKDETYRNSERHLNQDRELKKRRESDKELLTKKRNECDYL